jgi:hypothetical protein
MRMLAAESCCLSALMSLEVSPFRIRTVICSSLPPSIEICLMSCEVTYSHIRKSNKLEKEKSEAKEIEIFRPFYICPCLVVWTLESSDRFASLGWDCLPPSHQPAKTAVYFICWLQPGGRKPTPAFGRGDAQTQSSHANLFYGGESLRSEMIIDVTYLCTFGWIRAKTATTSTL